MMNRRKFIKVFGIFSLGITFLPRFFTRRTWSEIGLPINVKANRFWLSGIPKRGCSSSFLISEQNVSFENYLYDLHSLSNLG